MATLNLAAQAAQGLVALSLGPLSDMQERSAKDRCQIAIAKGLSVTETLERATPPDEGKIGIFELVLWRPEFAKEGYPQIEQSRTPAEGTLAITDRSVSFIPPPGATSVRIPYELVQEIEVSPKAATGVPRSVIVKSCSGRFDIVTFQHVGDLDAAAAAEAAAYLEARVAAFRKGTDN